MASQENFQTHFGGEEGTNIRYEILRKGCSADPTIAIHTDSEDRTAEFNAGESEKQLEYEGPVAEVFMTPMVGDETSLSASAGASDESIFTRNMHSSESSSYLTPSKKSNRSLVAQKTPEGLKPRPNFQSLQSRIQTTMSSDEFSVRSANQSCASSISRWSKIPFRQSQNVFRGEILPMNHGRIRNNTHSLQNFHNGWDSHPTSRLTSAPESNSVSNERSLRLLSTPKTPLLKSASAAKTAVGATVAESIKPCDTGSQYSGGSRNSHSFRSQLSSSYSHSFRSQRSNYWNGSSSENESSQKWVGAVVNFDVDVDYEPLTAVGRVVKGMSNKTTYS